MNDTHIAKLALLGESWAEARARLRGKLTPEGKLKCSTWGCPHNCATPAEIDTQTCCECIERVEREQQAALKAQADDACTFTRLIPAGTWLDVDGKTIALHPAPCEGAGDEQAPQWITITPNTLEVRVLMVAGERRVEETWSISRNVASVFLHRPDGSLAMRLLD